MRLFNFIITHGDATITAPEVTFVSGVQKTTPSTKNIKAGGNFVLLANVLLDNIDTSTLYGNMNSFISASINNESKLELLGSVSSNDEVTSGGSRMNASAQTVFVAETNH